MELAVRLSDRIGESTSFIQSARTDVEFVQALSHPAKDNLQTRMSAAGSQSNMHLTIPGGTSLPSWTSTIGEVPPSLSVQELLE